MAKQLMLIINPAAGKGEGSTVGGRLLDMYDAAGYEFKVHFTRKEGDAGRFAAQCDQNIDKIVCVGGDGTLSETLSGLLQAKYQPEICYVPMGSTNDLARSMNLSFDPMEAGKLVMEGESSLVDAGLFNDRYFSYVACFGAFSSTSYETDRSLKNKLGHFAYVLSGAKELTNIRPYPVRVECKEGVIEGDFLFGAVCNTRTVGGLLKLPVTVDELSDGRHELFLVREPKDINETQQLLTALTLGNYKSDLIECHSVSQATFHMPEEMPWSLDGERADAGRKVEFSTVPHAYRLMLPRKE